MKMTMNWMDDMTFKNLMQLELLILTLLPVVILLIFAFISITHRADATIESLAISLILCTLTTFLGEAIIVLLSQHLLKKRLMEIAILCHDVVAGNNSKRLWVHGRDEFAIVARSLNTLLDTLQGKEGERSHIHAYEQSSSLEMQLETLLQHIGPVVNGDLRVHANVTPDTVGVVADAFNYLVDELSHIVKRVQFASSHILSTTRDLLNRSTELAHYLDEQVMGLEKTTTLAETVTASLQHLTRILQLDMLRLEHEHSLAPSALASEKPVSWHEHQEHLRKMQLKSALLVNKIHFIERLVQLEDRRRVTLKHGKRHGVLQVLAEKAVPDKPSRSLVAMVKEAAAYAEQLSRSLEQIVDVSDFKQPSMQVVLGEDEDTTQKQRYIQTLQHASQTVEDNTSLVEHLVTELYTLLAQSQQQNTSLLNTAERISTFATLAEQWRDSVTTFYLADTSNDESAMGSNSSPSEVFDSSPYLQER